MREKLRADHAIGLMIDMQERLMPAMGRRDTVTVRTRFLLQAMNILSVPVMVSQQYTRGLGMTEKDLMEAGDLDSYYEKITYSCMDEPGMYAAIKEGPANVILWGVEAHICVLQTALDLRSMGKTVYLVADCTDSRSSMDREIAFRRMEQAGIVLTTSESIVYELLGRAGTETFRSISALVKQTPVNS